MAKDTPLTSIIEEDCTPKASLKMMFVLCTPRSGSTLLQMCLRTQKAFFAPQELHLLQFQTMGERARYLEGDLYVLRDGLISAVAELLKLRKTDSSAESCKEESATLVADWEANDLSTFLVYQELQNMCFPQILVDKSPSYCDDLKVLNRGRELFPQAYWIHLT